MWQQEFTWFFVLFHREFRQGNRIAFEVLMALAFAHFFGFYNPKQLADFLDIPHQKFGDPRKAGRFSVGHVLCGTEFSHEFNHPTEDRPAWDFGREVA